MAFLPKEVLYPYEYKGNSAGILRFPDKSYQSALMQSALFARILTTWTAFLIASPWHILSAVVSHKLTSITDN